MKTNIYELGPLNTERIAKYRKLAEDYNIEEGTVRDIFCKGADWGLEVAERKSDVIYVDKPMCLPDECDHPENMRTRYDGGSSWCNKCWSYVDLPSTDKCKFYDCDQGRYKCINPKVKSSRCKGVCVNYEE